MNTDIKASNIEERTALRVKELYRSYGFSEYRLSGFEDYSLYADNKSFLNGNGVLTFSMSGRLMALRPDVTLSVVKSVAAPSAKGAVNKLYYDETVYRKRSDGEFYELRQVGVEIIGDVDDVNEAEILRLAQETLAMTNGEYILDVSHAGLIQTLLDGMGLCGKDRKIALDCLEKKSVHEFDRTTAGLQLGGYGDAFRSLISMPSDPKRAIERLGEFSGLDGVSEKIRELERMISSGGKHVNVNFSIGGDADYYNGAVFKGYIGGVPCAVLSGGRYDKLLDKFGKTGKAIGFALYVGEIGNYFESARDLPDTVVVYTDKTKYAALETAEKLRRKGISVLLSREKPNFAANTVYAEEEHD